MRPGFGAFGSGTIVNAGVNFAALGAAFWLDASNPASYTESGGTLTSLISLVSGTPLTTITGAPKLVIDPRDNRPAFYGSGADAVMGTDATMAAAATGTNRPFTCVAVFQVAATSGTGYLFTCNLSSGTHGWYLGQVSPGIRIAQAGPGGFISATSENAVAGLLIVTTRSPDGLTVYTSVNGAPETSVTVAAHGAMSPDRVGIFTTSGSSPGTRFNGHLRELAFFGSDLGATAAASMAASMLAKWRPAPVVQFVGDSITTAQLANNGGMVAMAMAAARADGLDFDPQGPIAQANGNLGAVYTPYRYSAASGDTCAQMQTRVSSNTTGLGLGGGSSGFYRRTRLVCLHAGTNGLSTPEYTSLLSEIGARLAQHGLPDWRIAVTTIPEITGSEAGVAAFNGALPAIWDAFETTYPGSLLRWDCYACAPSRSDGTHPNDAGYVAMTTANGPGVSLYPTLKPYLQSIQ